MFAQSQCASGSGACSDQFTGSNGAAVTTYSAAWTKVKGTADAYTTGAGSVAIPGYNYAYYAYKSSSSDTSQITVNPSATTNFYAREACVRLTPYVGGYCVGFGSVTNGSYYTCYVEKAGMALGSGNCGLVSAQVSHTLAIVASGTSSVTLDVYLDGVRTGSVADYGQALTAQSPGFALVGDGNPANSLASYWQDYKGVTAPSPGTAAAAVAFGCTSGTGTCYDTFAGNAASGLVQYNSTWIKAKGTGDAFLTGAKSVQVPSTAYAYYYYDASSSDTSQILATPSTGQRAYAREACVRANKNIGGYCVGFGGVSGGVYNSCYVEKGGQYLGNANCGTPSANTSHTLAIAASGTLPVTLQVYLDGVAVRSVVDYFGVYQKAHAGFALIGDGNPANTDMGTWRDYREVPVTAAPTFSPAAGTYTSVQNVTISSSTQGAVVHYTLDGSAPMATSPVYSSPIAVSASTTINAIAMASGQTVSPVATAAYQITLPALAAPGFTVASPYSGLATTVGLVNNASGSSVLYCQDTTNTCAPSVPYVSPISFLATGYIRAQSVQAGATPSAIAVWQGTWSAAQITTTSCPAGTQYKVYAGCTISASGGLPPYTYSYSQTTYAGLTEGLTLNPVTGLISGIVYGQGIYPVAFTVTDATGATVTKVIQISINGDNTTGGCSLFPADSIWHLNVANLPVDTSPAAPIYSAYLNSSIHMVFGSSLFDGGLPIFRVPYNQPYVPVTTTVYQSYFTSGPFPAYAPVESTQNSGEGGDRHVSIIQTAGGGNHCKLWEMFQGAPTSTGWTDSSNAYWDLESYDMLPQDTGSTDAAGLPVTPLLWNYDEVAGGCAPGAECGVVKHAGRLTLNHTLNYHVWPATAQSGLGLCTGGYQDDGHLLSQSNPPTSCSGSGAMGEIFRLKSSTANPAACVGHPQAQVLLTAMRNYGLMITDNGYTGGVVATADARWDDNDLSCLTNIRLSDFEPVNVSSKMINVNSSQVRP